MRTSVEARVSRSPAPQERDPRTGEAATEWVRLLAEPMRWRRCLRGFVVTSCGAQRPRPCQPFPCSFPVSPRQWPSGAIGAHAVRYAVPARKRTVAASRDSGAGRYDFRRGRHRVSSTRERLAGVADRTVSRPPKARLRATADFVPVGAGVHTGVAYVGAVGSDLTVADFTALGDPVNVTARLASLAGAGETLISEAAYTASGSDLGDLERRELSVRGRDAPLAVRVLRA